MVSTPVVFGIQTMLNDMIDISRIEAIKYTHQISKILLHRCPDQENAKLFIRQQAKGLTPRERWEHNVSEIQTPGWLGLSLRPILWIGGRQNKKGISWVSAFSLDFIEAVQVECGPSIAYVLCNSGPNSEPPTPLQIFSEAIMQILQVHTGILTIPQNISKLSLPRFEDIRDSPEIAFKLLADIFSIVNERCRRENTETFLLIDRIDILLSVESTHGKR